MCDDRSAHFSSKEGSISELKESYFLGRVLEGFVYASVLIQEQGVPLEKCSIQLFVTRVFHCILCVKLSVGCESVSNCWEKFQTAPNPFPCCSLWLPFLVCVCACVLTKATFNFIAVHKYTIL